MRWFEWPDWDSTAPGERTLLVFAAGPVDGEGADTFQVEVCTPTGLVELVGRDRVVSGRHLIFVEQIHPATVEAFIRDRLRRIDGHTWEEVAGKVARIGHWEFEDYTEAR